MDKFNFSFKNRDVTFHKLCLFAKKTNLDPFECLIQAFDQNALIDDNIDILKKFINYLKSIEYSQYKICSQIYQDIFASFIIGDKFENLLEFGATDGLDISNFIYLKIL